MPAVYLLLCPSSVRPLSVLCPSSACALRVLCPSSACALQDAPWEYAESTETIDNDHNPSFKHLFKLDTTTLAELKFELYHVNAGKLESKNLMGLLQGTVHALVKAGTRAHQLDNPNNAAFSKRCMDKGTMMILNVRVTEGTLAQAGQKGELQQVSASFFFFFFFRF